MNKQKVNLFNDGEVVSLIEHWKKQNEQYSKNPTWKGGEEYHQGVISGLDFALHMLERMGD